MNHYDQQYWEASGIEPDEERLPRWIGWGIALAVGLIVWYVLLNLSIRFFWH